VSKILFLTGEIKIHIFKTPCVISGTFPCFPNGTVVVRYSKQRSVALDFSGNMLC